MNFKIRRYEQIDSTNSEAVRLYQTGKLKSPTLLIACEQTEGKGHNNNKWESEPKKNLTFTLFLPEVPVAPADQFLMTKIVSLSLRDTVTNFLLAASITIKWPNDLYSNYKKIAGILIQNFIKGNRMDAMVIGVGLNVNQTRFGNHLPHATSMKKETGLHYDPDKVLMLFMNKLQNRMKALASQTHEEKLNHDYLKYLFLWKQWAFYKDINETFQARITGVTKFGQLQLEKTNGETSIYGFKEVALVHK